MNSRSGNTNFAATYPNQTIAAATNTFKRRTQSNSQPPLMPRARPRFSHKHAIAEARGGSPDSWFSLDRHHAEFRSTTSSLCSVGNVQFGCGKSFVANCPGAMKYSGLPYRAMELADSEE